MPMPMPTTMSTTSSPAETDLGARCAAIDLLVMDVDGVLTDGGILLDGQGAETKRFDVRDGSALASWRRLGHRAVILSGRTATAVDHRAAELGITPVLQGVSRKGVTFLALMAELGVEPRRACFVGDDLPDLPALREAGLAACPADAAPEVRASCHLVTSSPGGRGAVREIVETILKHQGRWSSVVSYYREE